ncbi:apolipoprotein L3-like [Eleutherodactylus coqui]|uniref:apolipoprotein L3-like n=1 Tax=Eleutherodactylus coqui TaxID=57060 RepID=UPI003461A526
MNMKFILSKRCRHKICKEADYENKKKQLTESAEYVRSTLSDLLAVIPGCHKKLLEIAEDLDTFHRGATIASVAGSSVGIAGGITTIAGLALAPITLGASLVVSGIGVAAAVAGGVTGASASIADSVNMKNKCKKAEDIVKTVDTKLKAFETASNELESLIKALEAMEKTGEIADTVSIGGRFAYAGIAVVRIVHLGELSAVAARGAQLAARGVKVVTAVSGVFAALFMVIDAVFLVKGIQELQNDTKTETATEIRKYVEAFQKLHQDLKEVARNLL